jgi:hypothetical protein
LMIMGHWVCDAGHRYDYGDLFYELHPITMCCITSPVTDCDPTPGNSAEEALAERGRRCDFPGHVGKPEAAAKSVADSSNY